jgi:uracil-DNA glycosylase family 4
MDARLTVGKLNRYGERRKHIESIHKRQKNNPTLRALRGDNPFVPAQGPLNPQIVVVGDISPQSWPHWEKALQADNLHRVRIYYTTLTKGRTVRSLSDKEIDRALVYLEEEIEVLQPSVVVPLGQDGVETFINDECISNVRGKRYDWDDYELVPVIHPRLVLSNPKARHIELVNDLAAVAGAVRKPIVRRKTA